jgi:two-component system response regulator
MPKKILLVEDSQHDAEFTLHALQHCRILNSVIHADDGGTGLWHLATTPDIALVLLDLKLRTLDGFELLKIMRADPRFVNMPVIVVSTSILPSDRSRAEVLGASGFVTKDYDLKNFSEAICLAFAPYEDLLNGSPEPV